MAEEAIAFLRAEARSPARTGIWSASAQVRFDRRELGQILNIYGRMVAAGEWRDYALDFLEECAVFSVFRRTSEMALFRVEKRPKLRNRQGQYCVIAASGHVLKRGHDLEHVLRVFDAKLFKALAAQA